MNLYFTLIPSFTHNWSKGEKKHDQTFNFYNQVYFSYIKNINQKMI